jgi:hypothetical protein
LIAVVGAPGDVAWKLPAVARRLRARLVRPKSPVVSPGRSH